MTETYNFNFDNTYKSLPKQFFERLRPDHVPDPKIVSINYKLAEEIGLNLTTATQQKLSRVFS